MSRIRCAICEGLFDPDESSSMPFCSERCRLVDLGRWIDEGYGLPYESEDKPESPGEPL